MESLVYSIADPSPQELSTFDRIWIHRSKSETWSLSKYHENIIYADTKFK